MAIVRLPLAFLVLVSACAVHDFQHFQTGPLTRGQLWAGVSEVAETRFRSSAVTDQGLGIFQSQWRHEVLRRGHAGRTRLRVELDPRPGPEEGWVVRYFIEQQRVADLERSFSPVEDDWEEDGQDAQQEQIFGARLRMRLGLELGQPQILPPEIIR
jgi:hypothetical protein